MKHTLSLFLVMLLFGFTASAQAQSNADMGRNPGMAFADLFGTNTSFTATADMMAKPLSGGDRHSMEMRYAVRDGKVRMEMDLTKMKGGNMTPEARQHMAQMGMDHSITLVKSGPDDGTYMIYPKLKSYVEVSKAMKAGSQDSDTPKMDKQKTGSETIDGHPCTRYKVTFTHKDGHTSEMTTWEANDLNNFPIQSRVEGGKTEVTIKFRDIDQSKPDASLFALPADYKQYDSMRGMIMSNMSSIMGGMMHRGN